MHPLYWLKSPIAHPAPPEHWSYSTLRAWRGCPRRWWLERCQYPNIEAKFYPSPVSAAALEGQLVHEVVEEWGKAARRGEDPGSVRILVKVALRAALLSLKDNPRVDAGRLGATVSLDACVAKAHNLIRDLEPEAPNSRSPRGGSTEGRGGVPSAAEEFWLVVHDPPLKGQLDRVRDGVVSDLKTGSPDPSHSDQLLFYAVLWWLKYGQSPERLELRYPETIVPVPVPSTEELEAAAAALGTEVEEARNQLDIGSAPARPSHENCQHCPVRQLCDDYWRSPKTVELRLIGTQEMPSGQPPHAYGDVHLVQLPADRRPDGAIVGVAVADGLGPVRVRVGAHLTPPTSEPAVRARLLGAKMATEGVERVITTTAATEVFWER